MAYLPRLALGTVGPESDFRPVFGAVVELLRRDGLQVQSFLAEASFAGYRDAASLTGLSPRHLDSWLMSRDACRAALQTGGAAADLAVVVGRLDREGPATGEAGSCLHTLCSWLQMPRVAVLDVSRCDPCCLPRRPGDVDALILDRVRDPRHAGRLATNLEALWGTPVVGALPELGAIRRTLTDDTVARGRKRDLCHELADRFLPFRDGRSIASLAWRGDLPGPAPQPNCLGTCKPGVRVALAYDEAFHCYFPDVLEELERHGATVTDFSPLHDEALPPGTELVYVGCGCPDKHAEALGANHCMKLALRSHLRRGGRIYGEGGGLAYLCQQMETPAGKLERMVGLFPAIARLAKEPKRPVPVELTLSRPNWLGPVGLRLRGYRNSRWQLEPAGALVGFAAEREAASDLVGSFHAVGSRLHLHFGALPGLLQHFFQPCPRCRAVPDPWTALS